VGVRHIAHRSPDTRGDAVGTGQLKVAQSNIHRMRPGMGMGMGEPAGRFGKRHPRTQSLTDRSRRCRHAGVEPGQRILGISERHQKCGNRLGRQPGSRTVV
jgi:hypothetical protein